MSAEPFANCLFPAEPAATIELPASWLCCACCLAVPAASRVAAPVSEQTNKVRPKQKRPIGAFGFLCRLLSASNCTPSFALCLCVLYPTSRAHRLKNSRLSFYQYTPSPSILRLTRPACPAPANRLLWQRSSLAADQSESRGRELPGSDWPSQPGERSGGRCTHGPCPGSAHPFICLHDKPGPLSLGRKLEDKHC